MLAKPGHYARRNGEGVIPRIRDRRLEGRRARGAPRRLSEDFGEGDRKGQHSRNHAANAEGQGIGLSVERFL